MAVDDSTINNAQNAEATRNDGPPAPVAPATKPAPAPSPAPVADRKKQINADPAYWGGSDPKKTAELRDEMRRLVTDPAGVAEEERVKQEVAAKLQPAEARRRQLSDPANADGIWSKDKVKQEAAMTELRGIVAQSEGRPAKRTADDITDAADAASWSKQMEETYGIERPDVPFEIEDQQEYDTQSGNFLAYMSRSGVAPDVVRELHTEFFDTIVR